MDKISLVFPTRNRPENLRRLDASLSTASVRPEVMMYIDADDTVSVPVAEELGFRYVCGPRQLLSRCYNEAAAKASGDILMLFGDDNVFRLPSWDNVIRSAFSCYPDRIAFVHGDDGYHGAALGTHGFVHRRWVDAVGYLVPPYFASWYVDNWLTDVANAINRKVYIPVIIAEHMHHSFGKAAYDATYADADPKHAVDGTVWAATREKRIDDIRKLRSVLWAKPI